MIRLFVALLSFLALPAFAGYAVLKPPAGFSTGPTGATYKPPGPMPNNVPAANDSSWAFPMGPSANDPKFSRGFATATAELSTGSEIVKVPFSFRYAATAGATVVSMLAANPLVAMGAASIPFILDWLNQNEQPPKYSHNGSKYQITEDEREETCTSWANWSCSSSGDAEVIGSFPQYCWRTVPAGNCPSRKMLQLADKTLVPVIKTKDLEISDFPTGKPITPALPFLLPHPLPIEVPSINPLPVPEPRPGVDPYSLPKPPSRPLEVPTSDPVPIPYTNPQKYKQPLTIIEPSPTTDSPFRVNVRPAERTVDSPTPMTGPSAPPVAIDPTTGQETFDRAGDKENPDLCEKNPNSIACLLKGDPGTLTPEPLSNVERSLAITPEGGFGPSNSACPAPQTVTIHGGQTLSFSWDLICQFADGIRPLVIAFAWLSAAFSFFGFARKD